MFEAYKAKLNEKPQGFSLFHKSPDLKKTIKFFTAPTLEELLKMVNRGNTGMDASLPMVDEDREFKSVQELLDYVDNSDFIVTDSSGSPISGYPIKPGDEEDAESAPNPVEQQLKQATNPKASASAAFNKKWNDRVNQLTQTARTAQNQVLQSGNTKEVTCMKCGAVGIAGKKFCGQCGADMTTGETAEQRAERTGKDLQGKPTQQQAPTQPRPQQSTPVPASSNTTIQAKVQNFGKELTAFQSMFDDLMKQFEELKK